ncbi:MAG: YhjD/YihY/BrkB family envelope integrity protein [Acidobacteriota bacterium]|jgi:membrane protein
MIEPTFIQRLRVPVLALRRGLERIRSRARSRSRARIVLGPWRRSGTRLGRFFLLTFGRSHRDGVLLTSSALAYVTILSVIPLLAAFTFVGARIFSRFQQETLDVFVQVLPYHEATITEQLEQFLTQAQELQGWGLIAFLATSLFAFATVEETINRIWNVSRRRPWRVRLLSFTMLIFWGPVLIGVTFSSLFLLRQTLGEGILESSVALNVAPFLALLLGLTMLYWLVPYTAVSFRCALAGGLAAAILFEILRQSFGLYVGLLSRPSQVYGRFAFALFFAISIQVAWTIVLYGSELAYCAQHYGALLRGMGREPHLQGRWLGLAAALLLTESLDRGEPIAELSELSDRLVVPPDELVPILEPLLAAEILRPTEGRERAYLLARPPHKVRLEQVIAAYDEGSERMFQPLPESLRGLLEGLSRKVEELRARGLGESTLAELLEERAEELPTEG